MPYIIRSDMMYTGSDRYTPEIRELLMQKCGNCQFSINEQSEANDKICTWHLKVVDCTEVCPQWERKN